MKIHFIGIGGIGVSALAQYYLTKGEKVSGSDLVSSGITDVLKKKGARIKIGKHNAKNIPSDVDLVIYSPAIQKNNPELKQIKHLTPNTQHPKIMSYPEALGELTKKYFTIAVSGTHGKSTTTAMIALILIKAGLNPTVILGTKLKEFNNTNFHLGGTPKYKIQDTKYKILIIEADEWNASFLYYWPKIIVLTNIEREHLDYYKNIRNILKTYKKYISHLNKKGVLVINNDDSNIFKIVNSKSEIRNPKQILNPKFQIQKYGIKQKEAEILKKILKIPGEHNISNALAALTVARALKIPDKISFKALSEYQGAWRRFDISNQKIKKSKNLKPISYKLVNDYGHHPTEIKVTLKAAREKWPKKKIWCVFQPHQYQRTFYLFNDFVRVFRETADRELAWAYSRRRRGSPKAAHTRAKQQRSEVALFACIITDIYDVAGREEKTIKEKISSEKLIKAIKRKNAIYLKKEKIINYLKKNLRGGEVVIIMGAGDIYNLTKELGMDASN